MPSSTRVGMHTLETALRRLACAGHRSPVHARDHLGVDSRASARVNAPVLHIRVVLAAGALALQTDADAGRRSCVGERMARLCMRRRGPRMPPYRVRLAVVVDSQHDAACPFDNMLAGVSRLQLFPGASLVAVLCWLLVVRRDPAADVRARI